MAKKKKKAEAVEETMSQEQVKAKIKEMEDAKRKAVVEVKADDKVTFNSWYHMRKQAIPRQHTKEVIWADFQARGMGASSTMEKYDRALQMYGVKL